MQIDKLCSVLFCCQPQRFRERDGWRSGRVSYPRWRLRWPGRWLWTGPRLLWWPGSFCDETTSSARSGRGSGEERGEKDRERRLKHLKHLRAEDGQGRASFWRTESGSELVVSRRGRKVSGKDSVSHRLTQTTESEKLPMQVLTWRRQMWWVWAAGVTLSH